MRITFISILLSCFIQIHCFASKEEVWNKNIPILLSKADSLKKVKQYTSAIVIYNQALKLASDNNRVENASYIYKKIGLIYYAQKNYIKAQEYYLKSIRKDSLSQNAADSHFNLALVYRKQQLPDSLLFHLTKSVQIYNGLEDSSKKFNTLYKAGMLLKNEGYYNEAISYFLKAYQGFDTLQKEKLKARASNAIAVTQRILGNLVISEKHYLEAIKIREKLGDTIEISFGYNNLGNLYKEQEKYELAKSYYKKAIQTQQGTTETKNLGKFYFNLGTVNYIEKNYLKAEKNYKKSIAIKKLEKNTLFLSTPYNELALIAIKMGKINTAKKYIDSASTIINLNQSKELLLRYYEIQTEYYKAINNYKEALESKNRYSILYKKLFQEKQVKAIQELQERYESKQKLKRIHELTQGNKLQKEVISKQQESISVRNWLLVITSILIVLAFVSYFLILQKQKTREKEYEIKKLSAIFKEQEIVKEKISKDLHDIVITSFDAIRLKILALPKSLNPKEVSKSIVSEIAAVNNQIRLISHRLSPLGDKIKESKLTEIILDQLTEFQYYRKIFVDIQLPLPDEINSFTLASQTNLYGILLEVLHNIEKHAQATEINISHQKTKENIHLEIVDNGVGFLNKDTIGVGLLNMKQRAQLLKGECIIKSAPSGTAVKVSFPIKPNMK